MSKFNDHYLDAIYDWCKATGIDPEKVFSANDWDEPKNSQYRSDSTISTFRCKPSLSLIVKGQINTSVFEEAIIIGEGGG
jgi:hypothetical protein